MLELIFNLQEKKEPKDGLKYIIPSKAITYTERVLKDYANLNPSNEGLVYWGGCENKNTVTISMVIAPKTESNWGRVVISKRSNFDFVRTLNRYGFTQIAQVHSHPTNWVDHSPGDDLYAAFKRDGLLSIVVPVYCRSGMTPLTSCGCHRYTNQSFIRLSKLFIKEHFSIVDSTEYFFEDLRR